MPVLIVFLMLLLTSCAKVVPMVPPVATDNFTEMRVPSTFDWRTTKSVVCDFKSESHVAKVNLYVGDASKPFASFLVGPGVDPVTLSLPSTVDAVKVKYDKAETLSDATTLNVVNGKVEYTVPGDSKVIDTENAKVATRYADGSEKDLVVYYPSVDGMGTIMFEDLWPSYGDYDFNDFVVNYNIELASDYKNKNKVGSVRLTLRVRAIGGSQPCNLYLQLDEIKSTQVATDGMLFMSRDSKNYVGTPSIRLLNDDKTKNDPALFEFSGITECANRPVGGSFLNTSKGFEIATDDLTEVVFFFDFGYPSAAMLKDLTFDKFNFFIGQPGDQGLKEIHVAGFKPSFLGDVLYKDLAGASSLTDKSTGFYKSNSNLVWGLSVPEEIPHAYEKEKFITAYPNFVKWAQSGGTECGDWYTNKSTNRDEGSLVIK